MSKNLKDHELRSIKWQSSPIVVACFAIAGTITWFESLYVVSVICLVFIALSQLAVSVVIREERRREREIVYNSLKKALLEYAEEESI